MIDQIKSLSEKYFDTVVAFRRHLHQYPELSFEEFQTTDYIQSKLTEIGIETTSKYAETGVVGYILGNNPEKQCLALRADIDALPIQEKNTVSYKSQNEGIMHACGHDVHSASLFGAANILYELRDQFEGTIKLIFQPGEEKLPGGAAVMIDNGVLKNPAVDAILGQHVFPELEAGKVGFRPGLYMASSDEIFITIEGKGGHAALAQDLRDPIQAMNHLLINLRKTVKDAEEDDIPYVIGFGDIQAHGATNVIPDTVKVEGTFRTMGEEWRKKAHKRMQRVARTIEEQFQVSIDLNIMNGYPFLKNNKHLTKQSKKYAIDYLGKDKVIDLPIRMSSEDFASYTHHAKGCFYRLGTAKSQTELNASVHTPIFDIDENALKTGMGLMSYLTIQNLSNH